MLTETRTVHDISRNDGFDLVIAAPYNTCNGQFGLPGNSTGD